MEFVYQTFTLTLFCNCGVWFIFKMGVIKSAINNININCCLCLNYGYLIIVSALFIHESTDQARDVESRPPVKKSLKFLYYLLTA